MNNIGTYIKHRRQLMSLTQVQLAERSGISQAAISRLENADCSMPLNHFISILQALRLEVADVLPTILKNNIIEITRALDAARKSKDIGQIEMLLQSRPSSFWRESPELNIYLLWHEAIILHSRGDERTAFHKIKRIDHQYRNVPACYEIVAQVMNNFGNMQDNLNAKLHAYTLAKELYLKSARTSYHIYIDILVNLSNTYCKAKNYKQSLRHVTSAYAVLQENESTYHMTSLTIIECNAYYFQRNHDVCMEKLLGARSVFDHANQLEVWERYNNLFCRE